MDVKDGDQMQLIVDDQIQLVVQLIMFSTPTDTSFLLYITYRQRTGNTKGSTKVSKYAMDIVS